MGKHKQPFPPLTCQCGQFTVSATTATKMTKQWVAMDVRDHHLGRPCGTGLVTL